MRQLSATIMPSSAKTSGWFSICESTDLMIMKLINAIVAGAIHCTSPLGDSIERRAPTYIPLRNSAMNTAKPDTPMSSSIVR